MVPPSHPPKRQSPTSLEADLRKISAQPHTIVKQSVFPMAMYCCLSLQEFYLIFKMEVEILS